MHDTQHPLILSQRHARLLEPAHRLDNDSPLFWRDEMSVALAHCKRIERLDGGWWKSVQLAQALTELPKLRQVRIVPRTPQAALVILRDEQAGPLRLCDHYSRGDAALRSDPMQRKLASAIHAGSAPLRAIQPKDEASLRGVHAVDAIDGTTAKRLHSQGRRAALQPRHHRQSPCRWRSQAMLRRYFSSHSLKPNIAMTM